MSFRAILLSRGPLCALSIFILSSGLVPSAAAQEPAIDGTLPEDYLPGLKPMLETALRESPNMIGNVMNVEVADAQRLYAGLAPMLPSVSGSMQYGESANTVSTNSAASSRNSGLFYTATIQQNLFQWGALKNQLEVQKVAEEIWQKNYAEAYRTFVTTLRRQYMALVVSKMNLANARFSLKLSQNTLALANANFNNGTIPAGAVIAPQMDVDDRQLWVDRSEQAYLHDRHAFAHEVGLKDVADDSIPSEIPEPKYSAAAASDLLADLLRDGARNTFQAQSDELNIHQYELQYKVAKVRLLPKIFASAGISEQNQTNATPTSVQQTAITTETYWLNANWSLFDGLATRGVKLQALSNRHYWERHLQALTDEIMEEAQNSRRNLDFAWRAMGIASRRRDLAAAGLEQSTKEFKLGNISQGDLDAITDGVNQAESANAAARVDFLSSWSDFVSLVGADPAMKNLPASYVRPSP